MLSATPLRVALNPGDVFGNITVISFVGRTKHSQQIWSAQCKCGTFFLVKKNQLFDKKKPRRSCGCLHKPFVPKHRPGGPIKHGMSRTNVYQIWSGLRRRCLSPKNKDYHLYGGRGIKVCERWESFENFYTDMGDPPLGYTIHRKDNDGNYEPDNCIWATVAFQNQHRGNCRMVMFDGEETAAAEVARRLRIKESTFYSWLNTLGADGAIQKANHYRPRKSGGRRSGRY